MTKNSFLAEVTFKGETMWKWGFPLDKLDLRMIVNAYLTKHNWVVKEFPNNTPGDDWVANFMGRHRLTNRIATNIQRKCAQISKEQLQEYFNNLEQEFKDAPASNIWNYDKTNLEMTLVPENMWWKEV